MGDRGEPGNAAERLRQERMEDGGDVPDSYMKIEIRKMSASGKSIQLAEESLRTLVSQYAKTNGYGYRLMQKPKTRLTPPAGYVAESQLLFCETSPPIDCRFDPKRHTLEMFVQILEQRGLVSELIRQ